MKIETPQFNPVLLYASGLRPIPPPKGKKVKNQKLRIPQKAEAQGVAAGAGSEVVPKR
jgi:hypothetical protein